MGGAFISPQQGKKRQDLKGVKRQEVNSSYLVSSASGKRKLVPAKITLERLSPCPLFVCFLLLFSIADSTSV